MNKVTEITRNFIFEDIAKSFMCWCGKLDEHKFLCRVFDLRSIPSKYNGKCAEDDIIRHCINNDDFEGNWYVDYFDLLTVEDSVFIKFITEMIHPLVVCTQSEQDSFIKIFNNRLVEDGFEVYEADKLSGQTLWGIREIENRDIAQLLHKMNLLKSGIEACSTNGQWSDSEYQQIRTLFKQHPVITKLLPDYINDYRDLKSIRSYMQDKGGYKIRREFINASLNPIFEYLENQDKEDLIPFLVDLPDADRLGEGGFGVVYKVKHEFIENLFFAFKFFRPHPFSEGKSDLERFFKEAKMLFSLNHPNIIRVFDVGKKNGEPFIKMEFFDGEDLNAILKQHGRLSPDKSLAMIIAIAEALCYAHVQAGIVHRDLKPANIMAAQPEKFKVIDFGLGAYLEDDLRSRLTCTNEKVATSAYTAPELLSDPKLLDIRCDIYSVGAIWYECLVSVRPQGAGFEARLENDCDLSEEYRRVILKCLAADPKQRYQDYELLLRDLRTLKGNGGISS